MELNIFTPSHDYQIDYIDPRFLSGMCQTLEKQYDTISERSVSQSI